MKDVIEARAAVERLLSDLGAAETRYQKAFNDAVDKHCLVVKGDKTFEDLWKAQFLSHSSSKAQEDAKDMVMQLQTTHRALRSTDAAVARAVSTLTAKAIDPKLSVSEVSDVTRSMSALERHLNLVHNKTRGWLSRWHDKITSPDTAPYGDVVIIADGQAVNPKAPASWLAAHA